MTWSRYPCLACGEPFDDLVSREEHYEHEGHGPRQVQQDVIDEARWAVAADDEPEPAGDDPAMRAALQHATARRRAMRLVRGGRT